MPGDVSIWTFIVGGGGGLLTFGGVILTTRLARKSQKESNLITANTAAATVEDLKFKQYRELLNEVQEERGAAVSRATALGERVDAMDKFMREHFAGYRAYIHTLRGQIFDLGGTPKPWPDNLEQ